MTGHDLALAIFFVALGAFGFFAFGYVGTKIKGMINTGVAPHADPPPVKPKPPVSKPSGGGGDL